MNASDQDTDSGFFVCLQPSCLPAKAGMYPASAKPLVSLVGHGYIPAFAVPGAHMSKQSGIYSITHKKSGKRYIGSAVNIEKRWSVHRCHLRKGTHHSRHLQSAWNKYGESAFAFEVVATCEKDELTAQEQFWIDAFQTANRKHGYNVSPTAGNCTGVEISESSRQKMADKWNDPEFRAKKSAINRESQNRPEVRAKHSERAKQSWSIPGRKESVAAKTKARMNTPETKAKYAERFSRPEVKAAIGAKSRAAWQDSNIRQKLIVGRRGEKNNRSRLTEADILDIRVRLERGEKQADIANLYGVAQTTISSIKRGATWGYV